MASRLDIMSRYCETGITMDSIEVRCESLFNSVWGMWGADFIVMFIF